MPNFAGFDRYDYPGDVVMDWLRANTNLHWCGYYLGPVPDHPGKTWMARRKHLADAGWGIAPLYVGRQVQGGCFTATAAQGLADGQNAARMMAAEGFDADTYVYLDIENGAPLSEPQAAYVKSWCSALEASGFRAGIYCSHTIALALHNLHPSARIWAFAVATTDSHPVPFPCPELGPAGCGYIGAFAWQLGQNCRVQVPPAHLGELDVDLSSCLTEDPSSPVASFQVAANAIASPPAGSMDAIAPSAEPALVETVIAPAAATALNPVVQACRTFWLRDKADCSKFVRDVAGACNVTLTGDANAIVGALISGTEGWTRLGDGVAAASSAAAGKLVVGGLQGSKQAHPDPHGHVVVVVPGDLNRGLYPTAYWGSLGGTPYENQTVNYAWVPADRDRVVYAAHDIGIGNDYPAQKPQ